MAGVFLFLLMGLFAFALVCASAAVLSILARLYRLTEALLFGTIGGILIFGRLARWSWTHAAIGIRKTRRNVRQGGLFAAQVAHARFFVWSYVLRTTYIRRELQARGKSVIPSNHDR